jgi:hypothetical protein
MKGSAGPATWIETPADDPRRIRKQPGNMKWPAWDAWAHPQSSGNQTRRPFKTDHREPGGGLAKAAIRNRDCSFVIEELQVHEPNVSFREHRDCQKTPAEFFRPSTFKEQ